MACINVSVQTISNPLNVVAETLVGKSIKATSSLKRDKLNILTTKLGERFKATVSIIRSLRVCSILRCKSR